MVCGKSYWNQTWGQPIWEQGVPRLELWCGEVLDTLSTHHSSTATRPVGLPLPYLHCLSLLTVSLSTSL